MSLRVYKYVVELRRKASELERKDINNNEAKSFLSRSQRQILCAIPSLILLYLLKNGFPSDFVSYISNALSILIGLFSTAIIFSFDKFYKNRDLTTASSNVKLIDIQSYNYTKQFVYITGYSIILCVFTLVFLSFSSLFETIASVNIWEYRVCLSGIDCDSIMNFLLVTLIVLQRFYIIYWMSTIVYNTLFTIGSLVKFMTLKMDR